MLIIMALDADKIFYIFFSLTNFAAFVEIFLNYSVMKKFIRFNIASKKVYKNFLMKKYPFTKRKN
jgi:hypothetical protein